MTLYISRGADPAVKIPITRDYEITVAALRDIDHEVLAATVGLTLAQFENVVREWDQGIGLPYGVLVHRKTHNYKTINPTHYANAEEAANAWAELGWRVVAVIPPNKPGSGWASTFLLERPVRVAHPAD